MKNFNQNIQYLFGIVLLMLVSCYSSRRAPIPVSQEDFICIPPPDDVITRKIEAETDATIAKVGKILSGNLSVNREVERIRDVLPGTYDFEVLEYRLCIAVVQNRLSKQDYSNLLSELLPKIKQPNDILIKVKTESPGVTVLIEGYSDRFSTVSDINGYALFKLPYEEFKDKEITVIFSVIGFTSISQKVKLESTAVQIEN